jgi:hypothetical protein
MSKPCIQVNIIPLIHQFFSTCKTYDLATEFLRTNRMSKIFDYTLVNSRKILLALVIYQFGKDVDYPEALQSKARQMILYFLKNKGDEENERKNVVEQYLIEFDNYKKEDLKKYMYELGVEYAQLQDIKDRMNGGELEDEVQWKEQIEHLQKKILEYVHSSNGYDEFQKCLASLLSIKQQMIEEAMEKTYWKMVLEDIQNKKFDLLIANFQDIKNMLLEIHEDQDTKEIMDENYFKQLLENELFDERAMIGQIDFIFGKMKKYGIPIYDSLIDKTKNGLIKEIQDNGLSPDVIVKTFQKTVPMLKFYLEIIQIYRKKIKEINNSGNKK